MNEELTHQAALLITNLNSALTGAGHAVADQLPAVLSGYVMYGIVSTSIIIVLSLGVLVTISWAYIRKVLPMVREDHDLAFAAVMASFFLAVVSSIILVSRIMVLTLIIWAPQVWIIRQGMQLLK